ncbi:MAG TPA: DUF6624 domain-containing protein [Fimbriimonadaceae bacterium]|nr:DUF6624 domain-containing protein [Fimbriimonadaceae bacterium]
MTLVAFFVAAALGAQQKDHQPPKVKDTFLQTQLIGMGMTDQEVRTRWVSYMQKGEAVPKSVIKEVKRVDEENLAMLRKIVDEHGWPTISMVGREAANAAFLVVQHGVSDKPFMQKVLGLMEPLLAKGEVAKQSYALLYDRTALQQGKKQRYGSQVKAVDGKWAVEPCEDMAHLDERRKVMGLMPIKEYLKMIEQMYGKAG